MNVGIIGSGPVGQSLAKAFRNEGHFVMLGTRDVAKPGVVKFHQETQIPVGTFEQAAKHAELIVLATKGTATEEAMRSAGLQNFHEKIVIDTTNPISDAPPTNGVIHYFTTLDDSLMERLQKLVPEARFVKAFNIVGNSFMYKPYFDGGRPTMFICGNDTHAKKTVTQILDSFGWEIEDMGKVEAARAIEPLAMLWCIPGFLRNRWSHAFKLLKM
jgi:8-hydroxy-5-deazaflavin:NADPH oxidoreductase